MLNISVIFTFPSVISAWGAGVKSMPAGEGEAVLFCDMSVTTAITKAATCNLKYCAIPMRCYVKDVSTLSGNLSAS